MRRETRQLSLAEALVGGGKGGRGWSGSPGRSTGASSTR